MGINRGLYKKPQFSKMSLLTMGKVSEISSELGSSSCSDNDDQ